MTSVRIETRGDKLHVASPYHPEFVQLARKLNGKFSAGSWQFDARDEEHVRRICREIYGTDGDDDVPRCTVRFRLGQAVRDQGLHQNEQGRWVYERESTVETGKSVFAFGRELAHIHHRDDRPKLGDGVVILDGDIQGGGSRKHPELQIGEDCVVEIRDVPVPIARNGETGHGADRVEIVGAEDVPQAAAPTTRELADAKLQELQSLVEQIREEHRENQAAREAAQDALGWLAQAGRCLADVY